jgi:molybdate transport system ATP-binding protein
VDTLVSLSVAIQKRFGGARPFRLEVDFMADPGITVLFGPSGAGKTTVLECISGLLTPDTGSIRLEEQELAGLRARDRRIGYLFQQPALFPHMTVRQNIGYGLQAAARRERVLQQIMERMRIVHLADRRPREISGGESQRVALARTLATEPRALLLDEPLSALDLATKQEIISDVRAWNSERRIPMIYVTHALHEAFALADKVVVLRGGRIVRQGAARAVLTHERENLMQMLC